MPSSNPLILSLRAVALAILLASPAGGQPWARWTVPNGALLDALRGQAAQFENVWNELLVAEIRASMAGADSAGRLTSLTRRVAKAEPLVLGSSIAADALSLRARWSPAQRRSRVAAAVAESLATAAQGARDLSRADSLFTIALRRYEALGEKRRTAWVLGSLGSVALLRRDLPAADRLYRQALKARRALGDPRLVGNTVSVLGSIATSQNRHDEAWNFLQEARALRERTGERAALGTTLGNLGNLAVARGWPDSARVYFQAALDLVVAEGDSARAHHVLHNYAIMLMDGPDPGAAMPLFERALAIRRQSGDRPGQAQVLRNMGNLLRQQGRFAEALQRLEESRAQAEGDAPFQRATQVIIGRTWIGLGDPAAARPPLERALALADSLNDLRGQAEALNNLAIAARLAEDARGAERLASRALDAAGSAGDSALVHDAAATIGELALDRGDLGRAQDWFERAAAAGLTEAVDARAADIQNLGAVAARDGRLDDAERLFREGLALSEAARSPDIEWPALLGLGDVAERRGDIASALAYDRQAAELIERLRAEQGSQRPSVALLARRLFAFEALIHLLTRLDARAPDSSWAAEAFHWSERARARALLDLVAASGGEVERARPLTLREAQGLLSSGKDALLAYSLGDSSTSLWVVTRGAWRHVSLPPRRALRPRIEILRRGLADPAAAESRATRAAARALYRTLVEPAAAMLEGVERLIVAPDGVLSLIPFEALLAIEVEGERPAPKRAYLGDRWSVSYTPSASALAASRGGSRGAGIVAVGDPAFGADAARLPPLPHTAAELAALRSSAEGQPWVALTGRDATRERLLGLAELRSARLVHVATHGEANEAEPERSRLWLAPAQDSLAPSFVSVADILGLRLRAGLVTLSACETGLGRLERGEGVMGLTRAFLAAGAHNVVVSLWKVNDRSTALLMKRFYRDLLEKHAPGPTALANARRALRKSKQTRSPFYWAPFVLVGSGEGI